MTNFAIADATGSGSGWNVTVEGQTFQCPSGCALDSPTPVKIASETTGLLAGEGVWTASGFSSTSLALSTPATLRRLPDEEVYRADILWTLSTGP